MDKMLEGKCNARPVFSRNTFTPPSKLDESPIEQKNHRNFPKDIEFQIAPEKIRQEQQVNCVNTKIEYRRKVENHVNESHFTHDNRNQASRLRTDQNYHDIIHSKRAPAQPKLSQKVEISPGIYVPLRQSSDTIEAIHNNTFNEGTCVSCEVDMYFRQDAEYVLCSECMVVNPIEVMNVYRKQNTMSSSGSGVVCMGLKIASYEK